MGILSGDHEERARTTGLHSTRQLFAADAETMRELPKDGRGWIGRKLSDGRYQVLSQLHGGGMGLVFLARDRCLDRRVVLKMPALQAASDWAKLLNERFAAEVRSLVELTHPNIVRLLDVGLEGEQPFAVLQYLPGGSLEDRVPPLANSADTRTMAFGTPAAPAGLDQSQPRQRTVQERLAGMATWLGPVADALDFIHERGYLHLDVKPGNILFDEHRYCYLSDFGLASTLKSLAADGWELGNRPPGTPGYMAPEVSLGDAYDGRADQFSLAMTVYRVLSGELPFAESVNPLATMVNQFTSGIPHLRESPLPIPPALADAIMQALAMEAGERFPDCRSFAETVLSFIPTPTAMSTTIRPRPMVVRQADIIASLPAPAILAATVRRAGDLSCRVVGQSHDGIEVASPVPDVWQRAGCPAHELLISMELRPRKDGSTLLHCSTLLPEEGRKALEQYFHALIRGWEATYEHTALLDRLLRPDSDEEGATPEVVVKSVPMSAGPATPVGFSRGNPHQQPTNSALAAKAFLPDGDPEIRPHTVIIEGAEGLVEGMLDNRSGDELTCFCPIPLSTGPVRVLLPGRAEMLPASVSFSIRQAQGKFCVKMRLD